MSFDVVFVGGGTAGCILAARLSENPDRRVCLLEAGPDYGPVDSGRWPADMVAGGEDNRTLGARIIGGCSAHNACVMPRGSPADYDEWGDEWRYEQLAPVSRAGEGDAADCAANTDRPGPFHAAFMDAARAADFPPLDDPDDPAHR